MPTLTLSHFFLFLPFHLMLCDSYTSFLLTFMCPPLFPLLYTFLPNVTFPCPLTLSTACPPNARLTMVHVSRPCPHYITVPTHCTSMLSVTFCTLPLHFYALPINFCATITFPWTPVTLHALVTLLAISTLHAHYIFILPADHATHQYRHFILVTIEIHHYCCPSPVSNCPL